MSTTFSTTVTGQVPYGTTIEERLGVSVIRFQQALEAFGRKLRVAMPGVIQSFDAQKQTVTVQPAISEEVRSGGILQTVALPTLVDVPILLPRAGGFTLTLPVQQGDECIVVFSDMCIDSWWQSGGVNNTQAEIRRHDLSDAIAILAPWSQPRVLENYSVDSAQLRKDDGGVVVDVASNGITLTAPNVTINASSTATIQANTINIEGSSAVNITGNNATKIENKTFLTHLHSGVQSGGSDTGPVA